MTTVKLEEFLNELLQQVNQNTLSPKISSLLSEMFITHKMEKEGIEINTFPNDHKEMMKCYMLGWFFYNNLKSSGPSDFDINQTFENKTNIDKYENNIIINETTKLN